MPDRQHKAYIQARKLSINTDMPIVLYCFTLGGALYYADTFTWPSHKAMQVCKFRRGREIE